jgi:hypothetical protein
MTPHPLAAYEPPLELANTVIGNELPCTYIACVDPMRGRQDASKLSP